MNKSVIAIFLALGFMVSSISVHAGNLKTALDCKNEAVAQAIRMTSVVWNGDVYHSSSDNVSAKDLGKNKYGHSMAIFSFNINRESTDPILYTMTVELDTAGQFCSWTKVIAKSILL